jgi:hypothetical protein
VRSAGDPAAASVVDDLGRQHTSPVVVLVSNNAYAVDQPVAQGSRPRLDAGRLGIIVLDRPGSRPPARVWSAPTVEIAASGPVHVGVDGEAVTLLAPIRCATRPSALRVRISRRHPGLSPSALGAR